MLSIVSESFVSASLTVSLFSDPRVETSDCKSSEDAEQPHRWSIRVEEVADDEDSELGGHSVASDSDAGADPAASNGSQDP